MNYDDGQEVRKGDQVQLGDDTGVVVFSIDTAEFDQNYPQHDWEYLQRGVMVDSQQHGLIHYAMTDPELQLISRAAPPRHHTEPA